MIDVILFLVGGWFGLQGLTLLWICRGSREIAEWRHRLVVMFSAGTALTLAFLMPLIVTTTLLRGLRLAWIGKLSFGLALIVLMNILWFWVAYPWMRRFQLRQIGRFIELE